jgi:ribosomal protein S18 acetylase RimI-like enzyme
VRQAIANQDAAIKAAAQKAAGVGKDTATILRRIEQRCIFAGVYGDWQLADVVPNVLSELQTTPSKGGKFALRKGVYNQTHTAIRKAAYPYRPACSAGPGEEVLEATCDGTVIGYLACHGDYFDDLSLLPGYHGSGVAKALICAAAKQNRSGRISLDVRACNLPAIALYTKLGFKKSKKNYPPFYDWHGGYSMSAEAVEIAKKMPTGFDTSALK